MPLPDLNAKEWTDAGNGLKIWDVVVGNGTAVPDGGRVECHYTGWLTDGTVFDSSKRRGVPIVFGLNQVIAGWQKGIPGMKPGGTRRLLIPAALGYGSSGAPPTIPPNATLIFEVELVSIR